VSDQKFSFSVQFIVCNVVTHYCVDASHASSDSATGPSFSLQWCNDASNQAGDPAGPPLVPLVDAHEP